MTLLGLQPPALTRSPDINTLEGGVAFGSTSTTYIRVKRCAYQRRVFTDDSQPALIKVRGSTA